VTTALSFSEAFRSNLSGVLVSTSANPFSLDELEEDDDTEVDTVTSDTSTERPPDDPSEKHSLAN
jgi:hypothetical protein